MIIFKRPPRTSCGFLLFYNIFSIAYFTDQGTFNHLFFPMIQPFHWLFSCDIEQQIILRFILGFIYICYSFTFIGFRIFSDKFCSCAPISLCTACARAVWMPEENFTCFLSVDTKYIVNLYIKNTFKLKLYQVTCYSDGIQESDMSPLFPFVS